MTHTPVRTQDMSQRLDTSDDSCICDQPDLPAKDCNGKKKKFHAKDVHSASPSPSIRMDTKSRQTDEGNSKRHKAADGTKEKGDSKGKVEESNSGHTVESSPKQMKDNAKPSLAPAKQDYIHVRARRGQATDSHSLAERVRREKISERMKFLQELVPGCSKITGKAVMLDEIINYVQALQHQVEFLSMKLAAVNSRMDFNVEGESLAKDMFQQHCSFIGQPFGPDTSAAYPQLQKNHMQIGFDPHVEGHSMGNLAEVEVAKMGSAQFPCINGYDDPVSQISNVWNDNLQCAFPRGLEQNRPTSFTSQGVHGHMKIELDFNLPAGCTS